MAATKWEFTESDFPVWAFVLRDVVVFVTEVELAATLLDDDEHTLLSVD